MIRRRGQGQTEYIILIGLVALVLIAAVRHFAFAVDEAIEGSVRALRRHEDPKDYAIDTDGDGVPDKGKGVHVGFTPGGDKVYDVPVEKPAGSGNWEWEYYLTPEASGTAYSGDIKPRKSISDLGGAGS